MSTDGRLADDGAAGDRERSRQARALAGLSDGLAASRREVAVLKRENAMLRAHLARAREDAPPAPVEVLSEQEVDVLRLIALGRTTRQIASKLRVSARAVGTHRAALEHKLGATTRADLVSYARAHRLAEQG